MTFQTALEAGPGVHGLEAVVIIDGIPVAFATRSGLTFDRGGLGWLNAAPASLTTVEALAVEGFSIEGSKLNHSMLMVEGGGASCTIKSDLRWDKYFERRRTPKTRLNEDLDTTETGVDVQSSAGWTAGDVLYVDREAILIGTVGANTFTGCTRVYAGLPGQMLHAHASGATVSSSPRALLGRMAEVWLYLAGNWRMERRLLVDSVQWDGTLKAWRLSFKEAIQILDRQIAVGLDALPVSAISIGQTANADPRTVITFTVSGGFALLPTTFTDGLHAHITLDNGSEQTVIMCEVFSIDNVTGDVAVISDRADEFRALAPNPQSASGTDGWRGYAAVVAAGRITLRLVMKLNTAPMDDFLKVALSTTGQGDNSGTYDVLWGNGTSGSSATVTGGEVERRFGAAIAVDLVDVAGVVATFSQVRAPGWCYWLGVGGQQNLRDMAEDVARALGGYWCIRDGKLTMRAMSGIGEYTPIAATIEDKHISVDGSFDAMDDETQALHTISVKCNVDPLTGETMGAVNVRDQRTYETFRDAAPAEDVTMRGLYVERPEAGHSADDFSILPAVLGELVARFGKTFWRRQNGLRRYTLTVPARFITLQPGDVVRVTCAALKAFDGGALDGNALEVTSTGSLNLADPSRVTIEVTDTWASKPTSPTGRVSSWSGGPPQIITLVTSHRFGGGTTPGRMFALGWKVRLLDASATPPFSAASGVLTVSALTDSTVTVTGVVGFTPAIGDLLVQANYNDADNTTENTSGVDQRGHAFIADNTGRLGTSDANADEWG